MKQMKGSDQYTVKSCIYRGSIRHRCFNPIRHQFKYTTAMLFIDLSSVNRQLDNFPITHSKYPSLGWLRRKDYTGDSSVCLEHLIRTTVENALGFRPLGKIFLLTHLRYWGFVMNPISVFYCYQPNGLLQAVVFQVTNTPWGEKIFYAMAINTNETKHRFNFDKRMHVSPFNVMNMQYRCRINSPNENLVLHLENIIGEQKHTDATLTLVSTPLTKGTLSALVLLRFPETIKVFSLIYWQAFKLWIKRVPFVPHSAKINK